MKSGRYRQALVRELLLMGLFVLLLTYEAPSALGGLPTPLEKSDFQHRTLSEERSAYLQALAQFDKPGLFVALDVLGRTTDRHPIEALRIERKDGTPRKLRVMLIGSQHGNEISGCEALLKLSGQWALGEDPEGLLDAVSFMIIPASNPDGIARRRRVNAQGVNLSTDYGLLSAPESTAVNAALLSFRPDVVLDIHESALLKAKSLGAEGWLTDFEAQFEYGNTPNIHPMLRRMSAEVLLPEILDTVVRQGLPANRYIGEITRTDQAITHGGLSAHNLRNKAGLLGAVSFLVENRLDPSKGRYPTPRNIRERVRKQVLCINAFLRVCRTHASQITNAVAAARARTGGDRVVWLRPEYGLDKNMPVKKIPLRRRDTGILVNHSFAYYGNILDGRPFVLPKRYRIEGHSDFFQEWLGHQGIEAVKRGGCDPGAPCLAVDTKQPRGLLLPLYLEQASTSSILGRLPFAAQEVKIEADE